MLELVGILLELIKGQKNRNDLKQHLKDEWKNKKQISEITDAITQLEKEINKSLRENGYKGPRTSEEE
jgi:predicted DNA-binding protein YlxM (UPF0122 family)